MHPYIFALGGNDNDGGKYKNQRVAGQQIEETQQEEAKLNQEQEDEQEEGEGAQRVMQLLVMAQRHGFDDLTQCCEFVLSRMLAVEPSLGNAEACMQFADSYGVTRLMRQSRDLLEAIHHPS